MTVVENLQYILHVEGGKIQTDIQIKIYDSMLEVLGFINHRDWCIKFATGVKKVTKWSFYSIFWLVWLQTTNNNSI